jgi:hypothetical protein
MAVTPDSKREALQAFIDKHDSLNPNNIEDEGGLGEGTVRKYLDGKTKSLNTATWDKIGVGLSRILRRPVRLYEYQGNDGEPVPWPGGLGVTSALEKTNNSDIPVTSLPPLLVWKLVHGATGRSGAFVLSSEAIDKVKREDRFEDAKRAFSCKLLDDTNGPGYRAGHTVVVDPDVGAVVGDLCIFTNETHISTGAPSIAAFLKGWTATHWIVSQNVVPGEQKLSREEYPQAWPVVVHYPHGA